MFKGRCHLKFKFKLVNVVTVRWNKHLGKPQHEEIYRTYIYFDCILHWTL
jgi:hypothetical protein